MSENKISLNAELAEKHLILSLIRQPSAVPEVSQIINSEDISETSYKSFYKGILELSSKKEKITMYSLFNTMTMLEYPYKNEDVGLFYEDPPLDHPVDIAKQVRLFSVNRSLLKATKLVDDSMKENNFDTLSLISEAKSTLEDLSKKLINDNNNSYEEELEEYFESVLSNEVKKQKAIPTPYPTLNKYINGGLKEEKLVTIGARPGIGKTVVATQCTATACSEGASVLYFSLEMGKNEILKRLIACHGNVLLNQVEAGAYRTDEVRERIIKAQEEIKNWKLEVIDNADITLEYISAVSQQKSQSKDGLDVIIIDYLQLISTKGIRKNNRQEIVAEMSRTCKMLARKLKCCVIILVQLNRESKGEDEDRLPSKADIRESGAIAADSDEILILHRKNRDDSPDPKLLLILDKNRSGAADKIIQLRCVLEKNILQDTRAENANQQAEQFIEDNLSDNSDSEWGNPDDLLDNSSDDFEDDFDDLFGGDD